MEDRKEYGAVRKEVLRIREKEKELNLKGRKLEPEEVKRLERLEVRLVNLGQNYIKKIREFLG